MVVADHTQVCDSLPALGLVEAALRWSLPHPARVLISLLQGEGNRARRPWLLLCTWLGQVVTTSQPSCLKEPCASADNTPAAPLHLHLHLSSRIQRFV